MKDNERYLILEADNVSSDIFVNFVCKTKRDAARCLKNSLKEVLSCYDSSEIDYVETSSDGYSVMLYNGDYFYGQIKKISI